MTHPTHNLLTFPLALRSALTGLALALMLPTGVVMADDSASPGEADDRAQAAAPQVQWQAQDTVGNPVVVPAPERTSVLLFLMADQSRSTYAVDQVRALLADEPGVQAVAIFSGHEAGVGAAQITESGTWPRPIVVDPEYKASGLMSVRVWPTTVIVNAAGEQVAHLGGLRASYTKDMRAYLDYCNGSIDKQALKQRLTSNGLVASTSDHVASRHLQLALRLLGKGQVAMAREELDRGLAVEPDNTQLLLASVRVHLLTGKPNEAIQTLDRLPDGAVSWRVKTLRGRAMVALGQWDQAREVLTDALKVNPDPAEAYYFLGRVHQHHQDWSEAAHAYRSAFEKSTASHGLAESETQEDD